MVLKGITYVYEQDGNVYQKMVGIFIKSELSDALDTIRRGYGEDKKTIVDSYDGNCDNHFIEYEDSLGDKSHFYTSDYVIGELYL